MLRYSKIIYIWTQELKANLESESSCPKTEIIFICGSTLQYMYHLMVKKIKDIILVTIGFCMTVVTAFGQNEMPPPPRMKGAPPPPGLPIDNGVILLLIVALVLGIYKIIKFSKSQKQA